jgi:uncharacterized protein DUF4286
MNLKREVVYSVTLQVNEDAVSEWLGWMLESHIPEVMATGCFEAYEIRRQLEPSVPARSSFEVRYLCASMEDYRRYQSRHAAGLQAAHTARFGGRFEASRKVFGSMETRS